MDYVKDGTLTIQARTIKEVNSIDRVVVYADGCQREYLMPLPEERKWISVSERLPKKERKTYLIATDTGYMCSCRWTDDVCGFGIHSEWGWHRIDKPKYSKVVAWMDLEPYKGE